MKKLVLIILLLAGTGVSAQDEDSNRIFIRVPSYHILTDSEWARQSINERIRYSLDHGETYSQLCGYRPHDTGRNVQQYIYSNTRQLHFLDEWFYSKRQIDLFNTYPDSVALLLREDLFENGEDLYYWHNIIAGMMPCWQVAQALADYYAFTGQNNSIPITLLLNWMRRNSFDKYQESVFTQLFKGSIKRLPHNNENKAKLQWRIDQYMDQLYKNNRDNIRQWDFDNQDILNRIKKGDNLYSSAGIVSDKTLNQFSVRELLAYCDQKPEHYLQLCAVPPGRNFDAFIYENFLQGDVQPSSYSERQLALLVKHQDSAAILLASDYHTRFLYKYAINPALLVSCNVWQAIPDIVKANKLQVMRNKVSLLVLCQLMIRNKFEPYLAFSRSSGKDGKLPRTPENVKTISELAMQFYQQQLKE